MTIDELIDRSVTEVIVKESFAEKLRSGKKLRIKMGFDPTKPDLHLGHAVGLRLLKKLQEAGHTIIFLIGDYTVKIGDPSGRNTTRPVLSDEEIKENANTYFSQVGKILDMEKAEVRANSEWFSKMSFNDVLKLAGKFTVAQILERDDFEKRIKAGYDISLHEILYPLMQAYDSVMLKADIEMGGSDQKFNMLAGRDLQKKMGQEPQDVVMVKLLVGLDGKDKMSKSLGNYIALTDTPSQMFGKVMSIPDNLIIEYFELATDVSEDAVSIVKKELEQAKNPRDVKAELAKLIVEEYHSAEEAEEAETEFNRIFRDKEKPTDMVEREVALGESRLDNLLMALEMAGSKSEARRLIEQGGVEVDCQKITNPEEIIEPKDGMVIKSGKRNFVKIRKIGEE